MKVVIGIQEDDVTIGGNETESTPRNIASPLYQHHPTMRNLLQTSATPFLLKEETILTAGRNDKGQLGTKIPLSTFSQHLHIADTIEEGSVQSIYAFHDTTLVQTKNGEVYAFGDCTNGQLGLGQYGSAIKPVLVCKGAEIICGSSKHALLVVNCGSRKMLFSSGRGSGGLLGQANNLDYSTFKLIPFFGYQKINIKHVACNENHSAAITDDGELYTWGRHISGCLGYQRKSDNEKVVSTPKKVSLQNCKRVACGLNHTVVLCDDGSVYTFGSNYLGQCSDSRPDEARKMDRLMVVSEPRRVIFDQHIENIKIKDIAAGSFHNLALTENGKIFGWGSNQEFQLLGDNKRPVHTPRVVNYRDHDVNIRDHVDSIVCHHKSSGCVTRNGSAYVWGEIAPLIAGNPQTRVLTVNNLYINPIQIMAEGLSISQMSLGKGHIVVVKCQASETAPVRRPRLSTWGARENKSVENLLVKSNISAESIDDIRLLTQDSGIPQSQLEAQLSSIFRLRVEVLQGTQEIGEICERIGCNENLTNLIVVRQNRTPSLGYRISSKLEITRGHTTSITIAKFHKSNLFTASKDGSIRRWNEQALCSKKYEGHSSEVLSLDFIAPRNSCHEFMVSCSADCEIFLWNIDTEEALQRITSHGNYVVNRIVVLENGDFISCGTGGAVFWHTIEYPSQGEEQGTMYPTIRSGLLYEFGYPVSFAEYDITKKRLTICTIDGKFRLFEVNWDSGNFTSRDILTLDLKAGIITSVVYVQNYVLIGTNLGNLIYSDINPSPSIIKKPERVLYTKIRPSPKGIVMMKHRRAIVQNGLQAAGLPSPETNSSQNVSDLIFIATEDGFIVVFEIRVQQKLIELIKMHTIRKHTSEFSRDYFRVKGFMNVSSDGKRLWTSGTFASSTWMSNFTRSNCVACLVFDIPAASSEADTYLEPVACLVGAKSALTCSATDETSIVIGTEEGIALKYKMSKTEKRQREACKGWPSWRIPFMDQADRHLILPQTQPQSVGSASHPRAPKIKHPKDIYAGTWVRYMIIKRGRINQYYTPFSMLIETLQRLSLSFSSTTEYPDFANILHWPLDLSLIGFNFDFRYSFWMSFVLSIGYFAFAYWLTLYANFFRNRMKNSLEDGMTWETVSTAIYVVGVIVSQILFQPIVESFVGAFYCENIKDLVDCHGPSHVAYAALSVVSMLIYLMFCYKLVICDSDPNNMRKNDLDMRLSGANVLTHYGSFKERMYDFLKWVKTPEGLDEDIHVFSKSNPAAEGINIIIKFTLIVIAVVLKENQLAVAIFLLVVFFMVAVYSIAYPSYLNRRLSSYESALYICLVYGNVMAIAASIHPSSSVPYILLVFGFFPLLYALTHIMAKYVLLRPQSFDNAQQNGVGSLQRSMDRSFTTSGPSFENHIKIELPESSVQSQE
eukprot:TRINITY_DN556_c0_g1_i6.p1 TRINITY_DN556_c0_g1~~TRINITY_DN556_c0_g1_i6.p1  ORF type:complete len:1411 (-),score=203.29 TRINITY_DN556_c0_g1_i6:236-4468(-)